MSATLENRACVEAGPVFFVIPFEGMGKEAMSSTRRGSQRHANDYYVTPVERIVEFLKAFLEYEPDALNCRILDPCAGGDERHPMSYPVALMKLGVPQSRIDTIDIRKDSLAQRIGDYLEIEIQPDYYGLIITNPPFGLAEDIIRKALHDVRLGGFVVMLLRLTFLGGVLRKKVFWDQVGKPKYIFVHSRRMSFTDNGQRDSIEYAHFVWQRGYKPTFSMLTVI